jgi:uncharacterized membrane protein YdjX (TVP38/TMEM64 family)
MKRYSILLLLVSVFFLVIYLLAETYKVPLLTNPKPFMDSATIGAAFMGITLLVVDVVLPVASSIVMVAHGALFGILAGTLMSLLGRGGAFLLGYYIGKKSQNYSKKFVTDEEMNKAHTVLRKWGVVGIVLSRPIPIVSETVSIAAGTASLPLMGSLLAATIGSLPEAVLFAATGSLAASFLNTSIVFLAIILISVIFWLFTRSRTRADLYSEKSHITRTSV